MELMGKNVRLKEGELLRREESNREYLMKLENRYLLRNYLLEAGRYSGRGMDENAMGGWEDPTCHARSFSGTLAVCRGASVSGDR